MGGVDGWRFRPPLYVKPEDWFAAAQSARTQARLVSAFRFLEGTPHAEIRRSDPHPIVMAVGRGMLRITVEGKPFTLHAGAALWIPEHADRIIPPRSTEARTLDYRIHFALIRGARLCSFSRQPLMRENAWEALTLARLLHEAHRHPRVHSGAHLRGLLLALAAEMLEPRPRARAGADRAVFTPRQRERIADVVLNNLLRGPTVAGLARSSGLTLDYFSRKFQSSYAMSPRAFIKHERMRAVAELLISTPLSVKEICHRFAIDKSHLIKQFRSVYGLSPTQYRRANE